MRNLMFPRRVVTPRQGLQGCTVYKSCWGKCVKVSRTAQKGDATTSEWIEFHVRVCCFFSPSPPLPPPPPAAPPPPRSALFVIHLSKF